ncbi:MAG: PDZ domain-containing protein, partial [Gammaproteobacteria bacterium]
LRSNHVDKLQVRVGQLPADTAGTGGESERTAGRRFDALGLATRALTRDERNQFRVAQGGIVVEQVGPGAAQAAGVRSGDVVLMLGDTPVTGPSQFQRLEKQLPDRPVPMLVRRPDQTLFLAVRAGRA